ncbi:MAG: hypothetical protein DWI58_02545 [Chloroflexi bacterium]|nr:MAG: hypothetical protein DWI58_02545 [Chloroflexota bacterium]
MLAVMILPGTTSASSAPASFPRTGDRADPRAPAEGPAPILQSVSLEALLSAITPLSTRSGDSLAATEQRATALDAPQIVSVYGFPGICTMGELGCHEAAAAVARARTLAAAYDRANGARGVLPAVHLIVAVAQPHPGEDGTYLAWMPEETIREWVELARRERVLLFLDVQIGWSDPLRDARRLAWALEEPFVHLALDPEFATRGRGLPPGDAIGTLDAPAVNAVQGYLAQLVRAGSLPSKMLVLHQFKPTMLTNKALYVDYAETRRIIDMDGFGSPEAKLSGYDAYARVGAEHAALKLFFHWDAPALTPEVLQALPQPPDYVIYQ